MAEKTYANESNKQALHLELPQHDDVPHNSTIYKLTLSMKRRFSPQLISQESISPEGAGEVRDLLRRLVEIDNESRALLKKVFSLLDKDEKLESYVKKRIEDPKVSRMWQLIEHVLACHEGDTHNSNNTNNNLDELISGADNSSDYYEIRSVKERDEVEEETRIHRFKVKTLGGGSQGASSTTTTGAK